MNKTITPLYKPIQPNLTQSPKPTLTRRKPTKSIMQYRSSTYQFLAKKLKTQMTKPSINPKKPYDVFINHRGIDTKRTIVTLLYDHLSGLNLNPFLDNKTMKPGDKLFDHIDNAIRHSKLAVTVFSPTYCRSYFCLHELALIMESKKTVIPIFCDIKPSELSVMIDNGYGKFKADEIRRFNWAIDEAKFTAGLHFDSLKGNWSDAVRKASDVVMERLMETEADE